MLSELDQPIHTPIPERDPQKRGRSIPGMHDLRRPAALAAATVAAALCVVPAAGQGTRRTQTESELKAVQSEIAHVRASVSRDQAESDRVTRELRSAELSVAAARAALAQVRAERSARTLERVALEAQRKQSAARIAAERGTLAGEMRAAYLIGRDEPLKLLLNQQDPARVGRMFVYYGYFGRARAEELERVRAQVAKLDQLDGELASEEQRLAALQGEHQSEVDRLEHARAERTAALAALQADSRTRTERLARLTREQEGLEHLLAQLRRSLATVPEGNSPFARLRGRLAWPVPGRIVASFGETRAGAVKWEGVLIQTERGAPVRAVSGGRVVFADWLPGLGLLTIIDHGGGYLSLYGHNERLYKSVGDAVAAGDPIAAAGDSGGTARPELYFEIRKAGRAIDPLPWFRASVPGGAG